MQLHMVDQLSRCTYDSGDYGDDVGNDGDKNNDDDDDQYPVG